MRLYFCFLIRYLFPFLYAEVIRPVPTEGKWGVMENRDYCCFSIKIRNIHSSCATTAGAPEEVFLLSDKIGGERQSLIDGITNYLYIENFPTLATPPSYTDFEQQPATNTSEVSTAYILIGQSYLKARASGTLGDVGIILHLMLH